MRLFKKKQHEAEVLLDPQEQRLNAISELTRGLGEMSSTTSWTL